MNQILCTEEYLGNKTIDNTNKIETINKKENNIEKLKIETIKPIQTVKQEKVKRTKNKAKHSGNDWRISVRRLERKTITSMAIVFCICLLFSYCIYACGIILKNDEATEMPQGVTEVEEKVEEPIEKIVEEPQTVTSKEMIGLDSTEYKTNSGDTYTISAILNIPSLGIRYPVLSKNSEELMEISLNKYWGSEPNEVGNCCIVGHNYLNKTHFGKLPGIKVGDEVEITDTTGRTLTYVVYKTFIIDPDETECTSQLTDGRTEITLITCANGGASRFVAKCVAIEK